MPTNVRYAPDSDRFAALHGTSILLRQHDRDHSLRNAGIWGIGRVR